MEIKIGKLGAEAAHRCIQFPLVHWEAPSPFQKGSPERGRKWRGDS